MTIFTILDESPPLSNINDILLHETLVPESIFYVALASLVPSCPQISPHLTKSSSHFLCLDCMCLQVRQEGGKKAWKGRREKS